MVQSFAWGVIASSSLLIGGFLALRFVVSRRLLGLVMAFGAGVLISAVAFELVLAGIQTSGGQGGVFGGLLVGSVTFFVGDWLVDRYGGSQRKHSGGGQASGSALAIVLGIVLDGIPESVVLGLTVLQEETVDAAILVAVFLSNIPEAFAASSGLSTAGWPRRHVMGLWCLVAAVCGLASVTGYALFDESSPRTVAFVLAFAGGAILTMLADTMMPEAFEHGGRLVGLMTTLGFALAAGISALQ
jgi:ZIP family zinc transporter